jgi:thiol-disulfide isomerase/thioredoxin
MSIPFDDTSSISSISTISTTFGAGEEPCSWLGPLIGVIGVVLLGVLVYYWVCDDKKRRYRHHKEHRLLPVNPSNHGMMPLQPSHRGMMPLQPAHHGMMPLQPANMAGGPNVAMLAASDTKWSGQVEDIDGGKAMAKIKGNTEVVVALLAQGCSWCKKLQPELHKAAKQSRVPVYTVHASKAGPLLKQLKVNGFPHIIKFKNGAPAKQQPGYTTADKLLQLFHS